LNNSGGLGTASFIELPGVWLWRSAPRVDRILYSSNRASHAQKRHESRQPAPRQGPAARFRGRAPHRRSPDRTSMVQMAKHADVMESFWCMRAILHFFGEHVGGAYPAGQADIRAAAPR